MAFYEITLTVEGRNINSVEKKLKEQYPEAEIKVEKIEPSPSRADRLDRAAALVDEAKGIVEELREELQAWHDNLPENFSAKAEEIEEAVSSLEETYDQLEEVQFDVEFPSAF